MKFGQRLGLNILSLALGVISIVLGFNEATFDIFDRIGSNC
jgi:hypothetical protein